MKFISRAVVLWAVVFVLFGCRLWDPSEKGSDLTLVEVTKWYNDFQSAYSATYDMGEPDLMATENEWLIERGLTIDYEVVSAAYDLDPVGLNYLKSRLIPQGFGYFGHGHAHDNHDTMTYEEAYASFRTNYERMKSYGMKPVAYAYPYGAGVEERTRIALKNAGFYSARMANFTDDSIYTPYILKGQRPEPHDWYRLPALYMESLEFQGCEPCVNDHEEFKVHLEESVRQTTWMISMYHSIGWDGVTEGRFVAWGYYRRADFYRDMELVKKLREEGKVWLASMNDVTRYIRQRSATATGLNRTGKSYRLTLQHPLDPEVFDHEMTLRMRASSGIMGKFLHVYAEGAETPYTTVEVTSPEILVNVPPSKTPYRIDVSSSAATD